MAAGHSACAEMDEPSLLVPARHPPCSPMCLGSASVPGGAGLGDPDVGAVEVLERP